MIRIIVHKIDPEVSGSILWTFSVQILKGTLWIKGYLLTLSDLKTLLSFQFVFCETWQFNSRHLRIKDEILSYPFLFLASSIFFAVSTLKYLTLAFCHSLDCCCCLQRDGGSEGHRGRTPPPSQFWKTSLPYFNLSGSNAQNIHWKWGQ